MKGDFFDTNVLIYAASGDPRKANRVEEIISGGGAISVQVLNEVANVARRKLRLSWKETHDFLSLMRRLLTVFPLTHQTHDIGLELAERYSLPIYDAMIAASAVYAGCDRLWSEDFQHGMALNQRLRVVNPFRPAN